MKKDTRIARIVNSYFAPYSHVITNEDFEYVMEFVKVLLMSKGLFNPHEGEH